MKMRPTRFNIYLCLLAAASAILCGAEQKSISTNSPSKRSAADEAKRKAEEKKHSKEASTIRFHVETGALGTERSLEVSVLRSQPIKFFVEREPFINEGNVVSASLVEADDTFSIKIQLDRRGTWMLENMTASNTGKHLAIYSQFGDARWIAAPLIRNRLGKGEIIFTPDVSREEAVRLIRGLNNVAAKIQKKEKQ
ncbi:MAG: hypothetical protein HY043_24450 [Verrucomicrobia bacterium]|nr:hypothetical protein [Verrucomicrobiota bacterium]